MSMTYEIISTGSQGNAVIVNNRFCFDMGVPFNKIVGKLNNIKIIFLTHRHIDHFMLSTLKSINNTHPSIRFACPPHLVKRMVDAGIKEKMIDVLFYGKTYSYGAFECRCERTYHNVTNVCWHLRFKNGEQMIYATDTHSLGKIKAINYDLYLVEANYTEEEMKERIKWKIEQGTYSYESSAARNHMSRETIDKWLEHNAGANSEIVYLHQHVSKHKGENDDTTEEQQE